MSKLLIESAASGLTRSGNRWAVTLAVPGKGSSGTYSAEVFRETGPAAIPPGTRAYIGHPTKEKPNRDQRDLLGTYPDGGVWNEAGQKFESELEPLPHWREWVDAVAEHSALSIFMMAEADDDGNVLRFIPDQQNTVDLVAYPGLAGSGFDQKLEQARITQLFESAISHSTKPGAASAQETTKEGNMDKEILESVNALKAAFASFVAEQKVASDAAAKAKADAAAETAGVEEALKAYNEKVTAIEAATGLLPSQVTALRAEALRGTDVAPLIESAKTIAAEAVAAAKADAAPAGSTGFVLGSGQVAEASAALPKGW